MAENQPFIPNSYQTPNAYCDRFMYLLTPAEWKVLSYAVRRIFGFTKREDHISLSQFIHGTVSTVDGKFLDHGTGLSKPTVIACLDSLMHYRLITRLADNDPRENKGDLYSLQLDYDQVDYPGLVARANSHTSSNLLRTHSGRNAASQKRNSIPLNLPGQSDLPGEVVNGIDWGVVNGIDRGWSMGLTGGGQSDRPGVVNGIDTQNTVGNTEEIQKESVSHPDFDRACTILKDYNPNDYNAARPVLLAAWEKPYRLRIKLDSLPIGFIEAVRAALQQANPRRHYSVAFETPALNPPSIPAQAPAKKQAAPLKMEPDASVTDSVRARWESLKYEIGQDVKPITWRDLIEPAQLLSANGKWRIAVPNARWWEAHILHGLSRAYRRDTGQTMEFEFVELER